MDLRLKIKMACLVVIAFMAGAREYFPETLPWGVKALFAGLIAAAAALNGFLDQGVAAHALKNGTTGGVEEEDREEARKDLSSIPRRGLEMAD